VELSQADRNASFVCIFTCTLPQRHVVLAVGLVDAMAEVAGAVAVNELLALCQEKLSPKEYSTVARAVNLLVTHEIVTPELVGTFTYAELVEAGFAMGAARALKKAFPGDIGGGTDLDKMSQDLAMMREDLATYTTGMEPIKTPRTWHWLGMRERDQEDKVKKAQ